MFPNESKLRFMPSPIFRVINRFRWEYEKFINIRSCKSWELAKIKSQSYSDEKLLERNLLATQKVLNNEANAAYSQDGFVFSKIHKEPHWLNFISKTMSFKVFTVIDFGGGFADKFLQYRREITEVSMLRSWNVVEQEAYVSAAVSLNFMPDIVTFYSNIQRVPVEQDLDEIIIFASSICYVDDPMEILQYALSRNPKYIFIDRTPFGAKRRVLQSAVQTWKSSGDTFSYPIWVFNERKFLDLFQGSYSLSQSWSEKVQISHRFSHKGFLFSRVD